MDRVVEWFGGTVFAEVDWTKKPVLPAMLDTSDHSRAELAPKGIRWSPDFGILAHEIRWPRGFFREARDIGYAPFGASKQSVTSCQYRKCACGSARCSRLVPTLIILRIGCCGNPWESYGTSDVQTTGHSVGDATGG